jgi:hypothetical protein
VAVTNNFATGGAMWGQGFRPAAGLLPGAEFHVSPTFADRFFKGE